MKLSRDEFRDITRGFLTDILSPEDNVLKEQVSSPGRTESGQPQSYTDFAARLKEIHTLTEALGLDYVDSGWLSDGDHASLAGNVDDLDRSADSLSLAAEGLARSMGE